MAGVALVSSVLLGSCCDLPDFRLGSIGGRLDFGFRLAVDIDFDLDFRIDFGGSFDFSGWSGVRAGTSANLDFSTAGKVAYERTLKLDIDDDGVEETVKFVAFGDDPANPERVFVTWRGDEFTYDEGRCNLMWWDDEDVHVLNGSCNTDEAAVLCVEPRDGSSSPNCGVCSDAGTCVDCSSEVVDECVDEGESRIEAMESRGGSGGSGGAPGGAGGSGGVGGAPSPGGMSAGGSAGAPMETDPCLLAADQITTRAALCGLPPVRDRQELCESRINDVNSCVAIIAATTLLGGNPCDAVGGPNCVGVFP